MAVCPQWYDHTYHHDSARPHATHFPPTHTITSQQNQGPILFHPLRHFSPADQAQGRTTSLRARRMRNTRKSGFLAPPPFLLLTLTRRALRKQHAHTHTESNTRTLHHRISSVRGSYRYAQRRTRPTALARSLNGAGRVKIRSCGPPPPFGIEGRHGVLQASVGPSELP